MSVYDVLKERGFLKQLSHEDEIKELLEKEKITFYIGFDPTACLLYTSYTRNCQINGFNLPTKY